MLTGFVGGFAFSNHIPLNSTLTNQYQLITRSTSGPSSGIYNITKLNATQSAIQAGLANPLNIFATAGALGTLGNFFFSLTATVQGFLFLLGSPFLLLGIPATYIVTLGLVMLSILIGLGLLSALFIFNI